MCIRDRAVTDCHHHFTGDISMTTPFHCRRSLLGATTLALAGTLLPLAALALSLIHI